MSGQETVQAQRLITAKAQNSEVLNNTGTYLIIKPSIWYSFF